MPHESTASNESALQFVERETIALSNGGELEVCVKRIGGGKLSFSVNVRSAREKASLEETGEEYYDKLAGGTLPITGDGSIEGLLTAANYVKELVPRLPSLDAEELWIEGDERRIDAYRRFLLRIGFEETLGEQRTPAFVYRVT